MLRSIDSFGLAVGPMKKSDRRFTTLIDGDGQISNKTENKKRGFSSRNQYHRMMSNKNSNSKNYREKLEDSRRLNYENTISVIGLEKYKRWHLPEDRCEIIKDHFGEAIPDWFVSDDVRCCSGYYNESKSNYIWRPFQFASGIPGLEVYYTAVNRIDYAQELIERCQNAPEVILALIEMQDKYQLLTLHMELKNCYFEKQLTEIHEDNNDEGLSVLDYFDPNEEPVFSIKELPDSRKYMPFIFYYRETDATSTDNLLVQRFLFLLYKALPYPYKRRSIENAIVESWTDIMQRIFLKNSDKNDVEKERMKYERQFTVDIYQVTIRILMASLIGTYEHCKIFLNFPSRRKLYKWFCLMRENQEEFSLWALRYKEVLLCCYREYLFHMIDQVGGVSDYLNKRSHWNLLKHLTYDAMDNARLNIMNSLDKYMQCNDVNPIGYDTLWCNTDSLLTQLNSKVSDEASWYKERDYFEWYPGIPWLYQVQRDLDSANKNLLKCTNRPKVESFQKMVLIKMTEIESKMKKSTINRKSIDPDFLKPDIKKKVRDFIEEGDSFGVIPYQMLGDEPFNLNPRSLYDLQQAEYIYESEEGSVALKHVLTDLYNDYPYEYQMVKFFFVELGRRKGMAVYYTTKDIFEKQIEGLRRIYETIDGQELDESAGLYYICPNCNGIKIIVRDVSSYNNPDSMGGWSADGICICLDEDKFTCSYLNSKDTPKKRDPTKNIIKHISNPKEKGIDIDSLNVKRLMDIHDIKVLRMHCNDKDKEILDKYIYKRMEFDICAETELLPVYLPGHIIKLQNKMVMLCPQCLHPVYYSRYMFRNGVDQISCGCNNKLSETDLNCFVCGIECSDYCIIKLIWDDTSGYNLDSIPLKHVVLCYEHKSSWTNELDYIPKASQLDSVIKPRRIKITEEGKILSRTEKSKLTARAKAEEKRLLEKTRKKSAHELHKEYMNKYKRTSKDEDIIKKDISSSVYKKSLHNRMKDIVSKSKNSGKATYDISKMG